MTSTERQEIYHRYRPQVLDEVIGQPDALKIIKGYGNKIPHAIMFHGGPGTGKTTMARIIARMVGCDTTNSFDFHEVNCGAVDSPIDEVRKIRQEMSGSPLVSKCLVWLLDEMQTFSKSKGAQEALLKILEDGDDGAYFFICTTDPKKIIPTIHSRCSKITTKQVTGKTLSDYIRKVASKEKADPELSEDVINKIVDVSMGSVRTALVNLEKVIGLSSNKDRIEVIQPAEAERAAFDLVKALLPWDRSTTKWGPIAEILNSLHEQEQEPEGLRQMILASCRSVLCSPKEAAPKTRAYKIIQCLAEPLWDKNSGHALLAAGCYQAVLGAERKE